MKHTDQSHPDYQDLTKALDKMKSVAHEINVAMKDAENRTKILLIQDSFVNGNVKVSLFYLTMTNYVVVF